MSLYLFALLIGVVAGLRAMTAPAAVAWGAHLGLIPLQGTPLAWLGGTIAPWVFTALAVLELVSDQLPKTPSRKVPVQFGTRVLSGAFCGAAIGLVGDAWIGGAVAGAIGAVIGTLGGADARGRLAKALGKDLPAALIEDVVAVGGAILIVIATK
ncbi:membrane protein [soil metagenome]